MFSHIWKLSYVNLLFYFSCSRKKITSLLLFPLVVTEQGDQRSVPCQPFLLALCRHSDPGHHVHALGSQHGAHRQDPTTPATEVRRHTKESGLSVTFYQPVSRRFGGFFCSQLSFSGAFCLVARWQQYFSTSALLRCELGVSIVFFRLVR